jgi:hypothetical protein
MCTRSPTSLPRAFLLPLQLSFENPGANAWISDGDPLTIIGTSYANASGAVPNILVDSGVLRVALDTLASGEEGGAAL